MTCPSCGAANHADFSFCLQCGHPLAQSGQTVDIGGATRADMQPIGGGLQTEAGTMAMMAPEFDAAPSTSSSGSSVAQLRVEQGSVDDAVISLDRPITIIGRRQGSDIVIHDTNVSRMHAQISRDGSRLTIQDAGSSNGTIVNDVRIEQPVDLKDGDTIRIGDAVFLVEMQSATGGFDVDAPPEGSTMAIDLDSPMTSLGGAPSFNPPPMMSPQPAVAPAQPVVVPPEPVAPAAPPPMPEPSVPFTPPPAVVASNHTVLSDSLLDEEDLSVPGISIEAPARPSPAAYVAPAPFVAPEPVVASAPSVITSSPAPVPAPLPESRPSSAAPSSSSGGGSTTAALTSLRRELTEVGQDLTSFSTTLTSLADRVERLERNLDLATSDLASVADAIKGPDAAVLTELQGILFDIEKAADGPKLSDALAVLEQLAAQPRDIELLLKLSQQAGALESALRIHGRLVAAAPRLQATLARLTN